MNTLCWHKSGKNFASGYEKGEIIIWNAKNGEIQQRVLTLGGPKKIRRYPVRKLLWSTFNRDRSTLYAVGGTIMPDEPDGSVISIFGPQYQEYHFAHIGKVSDFLLTYNNPWPNGTDDPLSLIALPAEGGLQMYRILPLGFPPIQMPHAFTLHTSRIACIDYHTGISQQFIDDLREIIVETDRDRLKLIQEYWPMKHGGRTSSNITAHPAVIVTGHTDGFVRVWDASSVSLSLIGYFDAGKIISKKPTVPSITTVKLCPSSRTIVVAFLGGEVHVFAFRKVIPRSSHASSEVASEHLSPVLGEQSLAATALSAGPSTPVVSATSSPVDVKATVSIAPTIAARMNCAKIGGFYDTGIFVTHQARISSLALDTGIDRLCVGDQDGLLTITDLSSGICLLKCCLGEKPSTIHDLSVSHFAPTPTAKASSNTLLVSLDIGTLYGIDLHDCTILFNLKPTHISPVLSCYVVDENAQPVTIPPGKWSPVMEEEYLKEVQGPAHDSTADVHERAAESSSTEAPVTNVDVSTSAVAQPEAQAGGNPPSQDFGFEVIDMPEGQATVNPSLVNPQPEVPVTQSPDANETTSPPIESQTPSQEGQAAQPDKDHSQDPVPKPVPSVSETGTADSLPGGASATDRKAAQKDLEKRQSNRESKGYSLQTLFKFGRDKKQDDRKKEEEIKDDHASTNQAKSGVTSPHPTHPNCYVVQVCRNFIRMFLFPAQTRLFKIPVKDEINFSQLINWNGDVCLFTYDSANLIQIYALLDLRVIASFDASDDGGMFESDMKFRTAINSDGRIIASLDGTQLSRYSLIVDENELNLPASLPSVFTPSRLTPARPPVAGFFKTLFGTNQATDLQELFKTSGGSVRANSVPRTAQEDPESDPTEQTIHQEAQSTAAVVAETVNLLHQRGERLANLQNSVCLAKHALLLIHIDITHFK
eukprot:TRINITY_DN1726_c0_g1_i5.p1 TRINITY_DN1726_c0_g1~~TRINITY_DN1726_c0_g1_i5.p1  ORF type:complete len:932 (-),score=143.95 TRINITY_DN1726_c0_g1_i5:523-3318(-)